MSEAAEWAKKRQPAAVIFRVCFKFFINERVRLNDYGGLGRTGHFWRTHDRQEIDWVETREDGGLEAFECKWEKRAFKVPLGWQRTYPESEVHLVHRQNFGMYV